MPRPTAAASRLTAAVPPATTSHHRFCVPERPIAKQRQYPRWRRHSPPEKTSQGVQADWCGQGRRPPLVSPRLTPKRSCSTVKFSSGEQRTSPSIFTLRPMKIRTGRTLSLSPALQGSLQTPECRRRWREVETRSLPVRVSLSPVCHSNSPRPRGAPQDDPVPTRLRSKEQWWLIYSEGHQHGSDAAAESLAGMVDVGVS
jgi:hypothetical protein